MPNEKKNDEEHGVRLSYKFRIYPTPSQCEAIKANIDASRFVYNHYLRARMDAYERTQQEVRRQLRGVQPPARLQVGMGEPIVRRGARRHPHSPGVQPMRS